MVSIDRFSKSKIGQVDRVNRSAILKLNLIISCFNILKNKLLHFSSLVKAIYRKTYFVNSLVNSGILHSFIDTHFTKLLGLIL
jgi:hypothetical protein